MYQETNQNMASLLRLTAETERVATTAQAVATQAENRAKEVNAHYQLIREELKLIDAKKTLKMRLTDRERAIWLLYGKPTKK